jgi:hypothetical protein
MSIKFPFTIEDQAELNRLIAAIARVVINEVKPPELNPFLSLNDCYKESKSKTMVLIAIKAGELKLSKVGGKQVVRRKHFIEWING